MSALPFRLYLVADAEALGLDGRAMRDKAVLAAAKARDRAAIYWRTATSEIAAGLPAELRAFRAPLFVKESDLAAWPRLRAEGGAAGVHLKSDARTSAAEIRARFAARAWIARAVHDAAAARAARDEGADFAVFGHVFETATKPGLAPRGLDELARVCEEAAPLPIFAIGGITPERVKAVFGAGAAGVAALSQGFQDVEKYLEQTG